MIMTVESLITQHIDTWTSTVKTKSTSGRGSRKKLELYGVKKLRELILELAIRGKLVPQDLNDEPASVLLERIAAEKAQLVKENKIKKIKVLPQISEIEKPFELPNGWEWSTLNTLITVMDAGWSPACPSEPSPNNDTWGVLKTTAVQNMEYREEENKVLAVSKEPRPQYEVKVGDILVTRAGPKNRVGVSCLVKKTRPNLMISDKIIRFHLAEVGISESYIALCLNAGATAGYLESAKSGMAESQMNISQDKLKLSPIPLASTHEQHRIVAKVDELMALCDQLEQQTEASIEAHQLLVSTLLNTLTNSADADELMENWARISDHFDTLFTTEASIDQLKQTILQLAVMGKLVPQDPNDEPASVLLERIAEEKTQLIKDKKIKKQTALPPIADDEKPFELPKGWEWCRLPDLGELARGKSKHRPRNDPKLYDGGDIPLVQTGDVARSNGVIETYTAQYNEFGLKQSQLWPKGTLCITIAANIADTGILGFDACFPDSVVGFTPYDQNIPTVYFDYFIRTAKENLEKFAPSTAQKNINLEILSNVLVPCPPFKEYKRIVEQIQVMHDICDKLKQCLNNRQNIQLKLTDAIIEQVV